MADVVLGTAASDEPVPIDGRLGWFVHESVIGDPALDLLGTPVAGTIEEEALGAYFWVWFTPDEPLLPLAEYTFTYGAGQERQVVFRTGAADLDHLDPDAPFDADLSAIWYPASVSGPAFLSIQAAVQADADDLGSSRLSVVRFFRDDELGALTVMETDRTAIGWLSAEQEAGTERPEEVCVDVVHENGLGELSDPLEVCADVELAETTVPTTGCACDAGAPTSRTGAFAAFLPLLLLSIRRRARG